MIQEITSTLSTISITKDIIKSLLETKDEAKRKQIIIEFQSSILNLQQQLFAVNSEHERLVNIKNQIESELMKHINWEKEKEKYSLTELREGLFVYSYNKSNNDPAPNHWLCPYCFEKREKNILSKILANYTDYNCHKCGFKFKHK